MYSAGVKSTALRELKALPAKVRNKTAEAIDKLEINPRPSGCKKPTGSENRWRIRIGDYRILYEIDDTTRSVVIFRVSHRKTAYR
jgi:mRNA interferase RelE/StbE